MITRKQDETRGFLLDAKYRKAGQMEKEGKTIQWEDGYLIYILPFEDTRVFKYTVHPDCVDQIEHTLEQVHWGAFVELDFSNRQVISLTLLNDILINFYD